MSTQRDSDLKMVAEANQIESNLSDWEVEFIESLNKWLQKNAALTERQRAKLAAILTQKG